MGRRAAWPGSETYIKTLNTFCEPAHPSPPKWGQAGRIRYSQLTGSSLCASVSFNAHASVLRFKSAGMLLHEKIGFSYTLLITPREIAFRETDTIPAHKSGLCGLLLWGRRTAWLVLLCSK